VLEALAASFRSFDHVFIAGLDSARVPLRAPHSSLLDEHDRKALREAGLAIDTREDWEQRERSLFLNMLSTAGVSLTLSCSRYDESGAEQLPSAFYEEVAFACDITPHEIAGSRAFTPALPLAADLSAVSRAIDAAYAEQGRAAGAATPHNGRITDPGMLAWLAAELGETRVWSPTQLEAFAKCPWSYLSGRLMRLEKLEDPDLDIDALTRGAILHDALHRFYTAARGRVGGPVNLRTTDLDWARPVAAESIMSAIEHARGSVWVGHPALEKQKLAELSRQLVAFIEWEAEENDKADRRNTNAGRWVRTDVDEHEVAFDDVALEIDGITIRFRGFIDRVEVANDVRGGADHMIAAVDYKSSVYSTPGSGKPGAWDDGIVLQVPLYAYALTQIRPGSEPARVEYRTIRNRDRAHTLALYKYDKFGLNADDKAREKYESALHHVARHVRSARAGEFPPDPPPSCTCPPFCHARDICRIPGGPRSMR
jgi:RecB family exonuclease